MARLLILYPPLFAAQSKFLRKLARLTQNLPAFSVFYLNDPNGFIAELSLPASGLRPDSVHQVDALAQAQPTHAVVFDDGEEFADERAWLAEQGVPTRWVKIAITRVINIKREPDFQHRRSDAAYEYIGRGSYWGNPHATFAEGDSREEVIRKYAYDFTYDKFLNIDPRRVHELAGKRLGCFCKPAACHGDVLADFLNRFDDGQ